MADKATLNENETREVLQIRADIAQTRADLSDTIGAIQEKLSPARIREQAVDTVREATIGRVENMAGMIGDKMSDTRRGVMGFVSGNPVPLALMGLGAGWLAMSMRRAGHRREEFRTRFDERLAMQREGYPLGYESATYYGEAGLPTHEGDYYRTGDGGRHGRMQQARERMSEKASHIGERLSERASQMSDRVSGRSSEVGERMRERSDQFKERASELGDTVSERTHMARERVADAAHGFTDRTRSMAHDTGERARDFTRTASHKFEENPLFGGMVALALGAAAGMIIPVSDREAEVLGPRRDEFMSRTREMGREKLERARHVAEEVASDTKEFVQHSVQEHAREEGLMGGGEGGSMREPGRSGSTGTGYRGSGGERQGSSEQQGGGSFGG